MINKIVFLSFISALSLTSFAKEFDKTDKIKSIYLKSGKKDSNRIYLGTTSKTINHPIQSVMNGIINFTDKCNNDYKDKRKYTEKDFTCRYHNDHLIESFKLTELKTGWTKSEGERERFVMGRRVYNRGNFSYYELIQIIDGKNDKDQKTVTVIQRMLDDKEAKQYVDIKFDKDSAFDHSQGVFILTEIDSKTTELKYEYKSETEHWILNKEVSVPQVFASISKSINDLMGTIDKESSIQSRDLASHQ